MERPATLALRTLMIPKAMAGLQCCVRKTNGKRQIEFSWGWKSPGQSGPMLVWLKAILEQASVAAVLQILQVARATQSAHGVGGWPVGLTCIPVTRP